MRHWSAHATVGIQGKWCNALARPQPQSESDCWKWLFAAVRIAPATAKSPEVMPQKCAAGPDAVQIAERKEVVFHSWISSHPSRHHDCVCVGTNGEGASRHLSADGRNHFRRCASESQQPAREPGGRKTEIARGGSLPQRFDGL